MAGGAGGAVQSIVAGLSWLSAYQRRSDSVGRPPVGALALADSTAAVPGADGSVFLKEAPLAAIFPRRIRPVPSAEKIIVVDGTTIHYTHLALI